MNNKISIIIVDDNEIDLLVAKRLLSRVNPDFYIETFSSGGEVIAWMKNRNEDDYLGCSIFLIDIYMPGCNGYSVAAEIQETFKNYKKNAICFLLSATIDTSDKRKVENDANVKGFIGKPITIDTYNSIFSEFS